MRKLAKILCLIQFFFLLSFGLNANEKGPPFFDPPKDQLNEVFYLDLENSNGEFTTICVPIMYPEWFSLPTSCIEKMEELEKQDVFAKAKIAFKSEYSQLNTVLEAFTVAFDEGSDDELSLKWRPPWTWSKCAKCRLEVNAFITGTVFAATYAAGVTGPGAIAVAKALIIGKYGLAAWEAVHAAIFSAGVSEISRKICKSIGKC